MAEILPRCRRWMPAARSCRSLREPPQLQSPPDQEEPEEHCGIAPGDCAGAMGAQLDGNIQPHTKCRHPRVLPREADLPVAHEGSVLLEVLKHSTLLEGILTSQRAEDRFDAQVQHREVARHLAQVVDVVESSKLLVRGNSCAARCR